MSKPRFWLRFAVDATPDGGAETPPNAGQQPEPAQPEPPAPAEEKRQQFDADYVGKLRAEAAKYRTEAKANAEAAKRLAEIEEANKTEAQRQAEQLQKLQQENEALRLANLKAQVAASKGVPADLLSGSSEDELNAAADALLAFKGSAAPAAPDFGAGDRGAAPDPAATLLRDLQEARKAGNAPLAISIQRRIMALQNNNH